MVTVLTLVLIALLFISLPRWSHSANWGYFPSGLIGLVLIVLIILVFMGHL